MPQRLKYLITSTTVVLLAQISIVNAETGGIFAIAPFSELRDAGSEQQSFRDSFSDDGDGDLSQFPQAEVEFFLDKMIGDPYRYGSGFISSVRLTIGPFQALLGDGGISRGLYNDAGGIAGTRFDLGGMIPPSSDDQVYAGDFRLAGIVLLIYLEGIFEGDWDTLPFDLEELVATDAFVGASISVFFDGPRIDFGGSTTQVRPLNPLSINANGVYECTKAGGTDATVSSSFLLQDQDPIVSFMWQINASESYDDATPQLSLGLGENELSLTAVTTSGDIFEDNKTIIVEDSQPPVIELLVAPTRGSFKSDPSRYSVYYNVTDACDSKPEVQATAGIPVVSGSDIALNPRLIKTENEEGTLQVVVTALDESGNSAIERKQITK